MDVDLAPAESPVPSGECEAFSSDGDEELVDQAYVIMGTMMVIGASFVSCLGLNLQKLSHNKNEEKPIEERLPMWREWRWVLGMILIVSGSILDMVALLYVPMSRVAALGATGMIANIVVTPLFLKEKLTLHDIVGGAVTVIGTTIACVYGATKEQKLSSFCLLQNFLAGPFIGFAVIVLVGLAALYYLIVGFAHKQHLAVESGVILESLECVSAWKNLQVLHDLPVPNHLVFITRLGPQFYPVVHAVFAGTVGAQSVMFSKATLIFFKNAVTKDELTRSVICFFIFLLPTVGCLLTQVKYLNLSLKIYRDALFVLPVYQSLWISMGIISGLIFYKEYQSIDGADMAWFCLGNLTSLVGLLILTFRKSKTPELLSPGVRQCEEEKKDLLKMSFPPSSLAGSFSIMQQDLLHHRAFNLQEEDPVVVEDYPLLARPATSPGASYTSTPPQCPPAPEVTESR